MQKRAGFTLIELLIVVAIIAILAAIAVPNFLEAQTRSKIARSVADMRSVATAMEAYIVDYNREPRTDFPFAPGASANPNDPSDSCSQAYSGWWGFISPLLTTPIAYMTSRPVMPFIDETVLGFWEAIDSSNNQGNQPYTVIRNTGVSRGWVDGLTPGGGLPPTFPPEYAGARATQPFIDTVQTAGYVIYTSGADGVDSTVWGAATIYDPTNGTISFGDVYRFGGGSPDDNNWCQ